MTTSERIEELRMELELEKRLNAEHEKNIREMRWNFRCLRCEHWRFYAWMWGASFWGFLALVVAVLVYWMMVGK